MSKSKKHRTSKDLAVIELPDLIQSVGQSGRSGVLRIQGAGRIFLMHLKGGQIQALDWQSNMLIDSLTWLGLTSRDAIEQAGLGEVLKQTDDVIAKALVKREIVPEDGIRDAIDILLEEGFTEFLSWPDVEFDFVFEADAVTTPWAHYQMKLGTNVPPGAMLMEGLRRQDELKRCKDLIPGRWDVLVRDDDTLDMNQFNEHEQAVLGSWREGRPVGAVLQLSCLPPWAGQITAANLVERDVFRIGSSEDLVVFGDRARRSSNYRTAEGFYRRAIEFGAVAGRIHLALAELAERRGDLNQGAIDYLRAADGVADNNPIDAVLAYRSAIRLGADREKCLRQLLEIYRRLDEDDDAIDVLFELASYCEGSDRLDESMTAVREAQVLGADAVRCGQVLAGLALMNDDPKEAIIHLEQVIRAAVEQNREQEAAQSRRQLLILDPGRYDLALNHARYLATAGDRDEAVKTLRASLQANHIQANEDLLIKLREYLGELDPDDRSNHEALIESYQARDNRAGAANHLVALAQNQEKGADWPGLLDTLEQILALGGNIIDTLIRIARVQQQLGLSERSEQSWRRAIDAQLEGGDLSAANASVEEALAEHESSAVLYERAATIANRGGDRQVAELAYRRAALLSMGSGDGAHAAVMLAQLHALKPEDLGVRMLKAELAASRGGEQVEEELAEFSRYAARTENLGLALEFTQRRVALTPAPAFTPRAEMVELLRRLGRYQQELAEGQKLFDDLCEAGELDNAVELMQRLVASHSRNPQLVVQLAELYEAMSQEVDAVRFFKHALVLYQQEDKTAEAGQALQNLERLLPTDPEVSRAREYLDQGMAVNWSSIRQERAAANKRRLAGNASGGDTGSSARHAGSRRVQGGTDAILTPNTGV